MTDDTRDGKRLYNLSRRKVLGGLGAVGLASAGAGLGTSAYFSDTESFSGNTLSAGSLDLKVDWEEHYYDGSAGGEYVHYSEPADGGVPFPDPENPHVWLDSGDIVPEFMNATSIEAFPDPNHDGIQQMESGDWSYVPCEMGADLDEDLTPSDGGATRSDNEDTMVDGEPQPLLNLDDVKPGDFGEFTFSFHLCDNPGYVWLQAANVSESEGGETEPEGGVDDTEGGELASNIQTAWWYDTDGNNRINEDIGMVDVMIAVDTSGSLSDSDVAELSGDANTLATEIVNNADARVGGLSFGGGSIDNFTALADSPVSFSGLSPNGNTPMPAALDIAREELDANGRQGAETFIVLFTDGGPNYENKTYSAGGYDVGSGYTGGNLSPNGKVHDSELCETAEIADDIRQSHRILTVGINDNRDPNGNSDPQDCAGNAIASLATYLQNDIAGGQADYFSAEGVGEVGSILDAIIEAISVPEEVFHRGTLADDLAVLTDGDGIPLDGSLGTSFDEMSDSDDDPNRECFMPGVTEFIGFAWWLPADVGNEVQSDSVSFDLGFYTEQCRHNDGSGPSTTTTGGNQSAGAD